MDRNSNNVKKVTMHYTEVLDYIRELPDGSLQKPNQGEMVLIEKCIDELLFLEYCIKNCKQDLIGVGVLNGDIDRYLKVVRAYRQFINLTNGILQHIRITGYRHW